MELWKWMTVAGLALTLVGATILSWYDVRGGRNVTFADEKVGFPRPEARLGFPLIALGSLLQIVGVALS
jgi:hypothetical protein